MLLIKKSMLKNCIQNLQSWISHCTWFRFIELWSFRTTVSPKNNCQSRNQHNQIPLCTKFNFKQSTFKVQGQICQKKVILGTVFQKEIPEFRISNPEYSFIPNFVLSKAFWSFGAKLAQKNLGTEFEKTTADCVNLYWVSF